MMRLLEIINGIPYLIIVILLMMILTSNRAAAGILK